MAYYEGQLVIHNYVFPIHKKNDHENLDFRREMDGLNARESLKNLVDYNENTAFLREFGLDTWQKRLMYFLKPVARYFEVDDEALLQRYIRHTLPSHTMEAGINPVPFLESMSKAHA
jgi:hypothetical protein